MGSFHGLQTRRFFRAGAVERASGFDVARALADVFTACGLLFFLVDVAVRVLTAAATTPVTSVASANQRKRKFRMNNRSSGSSVVIG